MVNNLDRISNANDTVAQDVRSQAPTVRERLGACTNRRYSQRVGVRRRSALEGLYQPIQAAEALGDDDALGAATRAKAT